MHTNNGNSTCIEIFLKLNFAVDLVLKGYKTDLNRLMSPLLILIHPGLCYVMRVLKGITNVVKRTVITPGTSI